MRHYLFFLSSLLIFSMSVLGQSPGGVAKSSVWIKADVSSDSSLLGSLNFNPAMSLNNKIVQKIPGKVQSLRKVTAFIVYTDSLTGKEKDVWEITGPFGDLSLSTGKVSSRSKKLNRTFEYKVKNSQLPRPKAIIHTYQGRNINGSDLDSTEFKEPAIRFGNSSDSINASLKLIPEFILYERILDEEEVSKVETYLAIKYGITLGENYLNSAGEVVWNRSNDTGYSNSIAGIARDDQSSLYQRQSSSCTSPEHLEIGVNDISESNSKNTGHINDADYLVWGDNAESFRLKQNTAAGADDILIPRKKWLMRASGNTAKDLPTKLKIDVNTFLSGKLLKESFCLMINRSGSDDFGSEDCVYISPDDITRDGIATFSNIYWDTDGSGKDLFTFGFKPGSLSPVESAVKAPKTNNTSSFISFKVYPNPVSDRNYKVAVNLKKPADIQIIVYDLSGKLINTTKKSGQANYLFSGRINRPAGPYIIKLITPETELFHIMIVQ